MFAVACAQSEDELGVDPNTLLRAPVTCPGQAAGPLAFAEEVVSFEPGEGAGHGIEQLPQIVLGPPEGAQGARGSLDVVSLGFEGEIVLRLSSDVIDCEGEDLVVFENAFSYGSKTYSELGQVSVGMDGRSWVDFPCDAGGEWPYEGCAGVGEVPIDVDPVDPDSIWGDRFDLARIGVTRARYVRIKDLGVSNGPSAVPTRGFDLDALAIVNGHADTAPGRE